MIEATEGAPQYSTHTWDPIPARTSHNVMVQRWDGIRFEDLEAALRLARERGAAGHLGLSCSGTVLTLNWSDD